MAVSLSMSVSFGGLLVSLWEGHVGSLQASKDSTPQEAPPQKRTVSFAFAFPPQTARLLEQYTHGINHPQEAMPKVIVFLETNVPSKR